MPMSAAGGIPREMPSGMRARAAAAWLYRSIEARKRPKAKVQGAARAMSLRLPMITASLAEMNVSPNQASPRMPMMAVTPDWQVLHFGTSAGDAPVTTRITAAAVSMTMAMATGMPITMGSPVRDAKVWR